MLVALHYIDRSKVPKMPIPSWPDEEPFINENRHAYNGNDDEISRPGIDIVEDGVVRFVDLEEPTNGNVSI